MRRSTVLTLPFQLVFPVSEPMFNWRARKLMGETLKVVLAEFSQFFCDERNARGKYLSLSKVENSAKDLSC
jgi:hypothetical protein